MSNVCNHCGRDPSSPINPWRAAREAKGWTTREAADAAGVSHSLVSRIENGKEVEFRAGVALARAYGLSAEDLLAAVPRPEPRLRPGQKVSGRKVSAETLQRFVAYGWLAYACQPPARRVRTVPAAKALTESPAGFHIRAFTFGRSPARSECPKKV